MFCHDIDINSLPLKVFRLPGFNIFDTLFMKSSEREAEKNLNLARQKYLKKAKHFHC